MAAFNFRAVDATGKAQRGVVVAVNAQGARRILRERSLIATSVELVADGGARTVKGWPR